MGKNLIEKAKEWKEKIIENSNIWTKFGALLVIVAILISTFGIHFVSVSSPSMFPEIDTGGIAIATSRTAFDDLQVGDIIIYNHEEIGQIIHRVHTITETEDHQRVIITKGDNNEVCDKDFVTQELYRAKVICSTNLFAPILQIFFE